MFYENRYQSSSSDSAHADALEMCYEAIRVGNEEWKENKEKGRNKERMGELARVMNRLVEGELRNVFMGMEYRGIGCQGKRMQKVGEVKEMVGKLVTMAGREMHYTNELFLARGKIAMAMAFVGDSKDMKQALSQFEQLGSKVAVAMLYLGACHFYQQNYAEALDMFVKVAQSRPNAPSIVLNLIGLCCEKLGNFDLSGKFFKISLKRNSDDIIALVSLAMHDLNKADKANDAINALHRAVEIESGDSVVRINVLSPFLLYPIGSVLNYQGKYEQATHVLQRVLELANPCSSELRANSYYELGRCAHLQGKMTEAIKCYQTALKILPSSAKQKPSLPNCQLSLAKCYLKKKQFKDATAICRVLERAFPTNLEVLRVLSAAMYYDNDPDVKSLLVKLSQQDSDDSENWLRLGNVCLKSDHKKEAFAAFKKAVSRLRKSGKKVPVEIWNNLGTLAFYEERYDDARIAFSQCILQPLSVNNLTYYYNYARAEDALGYATDALRGYQKIIDSFADYIDAWLRRGVLEWKSGNFIKADDTFMTVLQKDPKNLAVIAYRASMHRERGDHKSAISIWNHACIAQQNSISDFLGIGFADAKLRESFEHAPQIKDFSLDPSKSQKLKELELIRDRCVELAANTYHSILKKSPHNIYAANGVGAICLRKGQVKEAVEVLAAIEEYGNRVPDIWLNLAHARMELYQFGSACKLVFYFLMLAFYEVFKVLEAILSRSKCNGVALFGSFVL